MQLKILRTNMFTVNIRNVFKTELGSRGYKVLKNKSLDHHLFIIFRILTYKTLSTLILWDFCKHVRGKRLQPHTLVFVVLLIIISPPWWFGIYATGSVGYRWGFSSRCLGRRLLGQWVILYLSIVRLFLLFPGEVQSILLWAD